MTKKKTEEPQEELLVLHEKWVKAARAHLKEIIAFSLALVFLASLWAGFNYYRERRENKAALLYAQALMSKDETQREKLLQKVIEDYGGTAASLEARLNLYELLVKKGKFKEALTTLEELRKKAKEPLRAFLDLGVGYLEEDLHQFASAEKDYRSGVKAKIGLEEIGYLDLARIAELQGEYGKAVKYYQEYVALKPQGIMLDFVEVKLSKLTEKITDKEKKSSKEG